MPIKSEAGFCLAESALGDVGLIFHGQVFNPNLTNLQSVSVQFDTAVSQVLGLAYCEPDPLLVEHVPHSRFDGLVARRSGAYCVSGYTGGQIYGIVAYLGRYTSFACIDAINYEHIDTAES